MSAATLTVVPDEGEANIIRGLLRSHGIRSSHRGTVMTASVWPIGATSPIEIVVDEKDLARARRVLENR
jgi:putative signal transducing protein